MSHGTVGMDPGVSPLSTYNSLTDGHLAGYYASPRKRRHLRKVGLISRSGHLISENTFRLNMAKKDRRRQVKNTLAQAIVEKTLELERYRQNVIKQKLEEIAKMELVQRVRDEEKQQPIRKKTSKFYSPRPQTAPLTTETDLRKRNQEMLPYLSPRSTRRPVSGPAPNKTGSSSYGKYRPISAPLHTRPASSSTKTSTNYDDYDDEEDVEYIDVNGETSSPRQTSYREDHNIDLNQLYTLNTVALRKYAMTLARMEKGQNGNSPYTTASTVPMPPRSPRNVTSARHRKYNTGGQADRSPQRTAGSTKNHLHPANSVTIHPGQLQSMVEVSMKYHGWNLSLVRDEIDPRNMVLIEQQHCGGNTLTVFKQKLRPGSEFTFVSHRHRGYPFSLTIYVDGRMDSRVSVCCEYRHARHVRLGGANGHFSLVDVKGNTPCYKCRVERGGKKKKKKRSQPEPMVEEIVVKKAVDESVKEDKNSDTESEDTGNYEDDFEQSDNEQKQNKDEDENVQEKKPEEENEHEKKNGDDLDIEEARIRGMSLDSPRDSGNRTPDFDKNQDEEKVYGRKIDAYSSEEEDLNGPNSTIVEVEKDDDPEKVAMTTKGKGKNLTSGEKSRKQQNEVAERSQMKTSKSAATNPPGGGKKRSIESRKTPGESSESEELTPRRQQVLTVQSTDNMSRTPSPQNQPGSPEVQIQSKDSPKKDSKAASPDQKRYSSDQKQYSPDQKLSSSDHRQSSPDQKRSSPDQRQSSTDQKTSPTTSPEILHTVWDEESEDTTEDWDQKKQSISRGILEEFGKKEEDSTYMADDEDTERTEQIQDRNERVASAILDTYGKDEEKSNQTKNKQVASAILDTFGEDPESNNEEKQKRVASAILDTYGKDEEKSKETKNKQVASAILDTYGKDPESNNEEKQKRVASAILDTYGKDPEQNKDSELDESQGGNIEEQILKQFGGSLAKEDDSSQKVDQQTPEKQSRISEEMQKHFGKDPVKPDLEERETKNLRISEEILKQLGGNNKDERVAEEIVKLYGQDKGSSSDKSKETSNENREWRTEEEIKPMAASKNEQDPASDKNIHNGQGEALKSKMDNSSKIEEEKGNLKSESQTVESSEISTATESSPITAVTTTEPSSTQQKSASASTETPKQTKFISDSEDSSSDSDTTSESDSESSLTTSDSDTASNIKTPRPENNGVKTEQKQENKAPESKSDLTNGASEKESESNEDPTKEQSKQTNAKPSKSVTFRNTPEPFTYHVSDTESENMQYGGNDPDQVGNGYPGQRPSITINSGVDSVKLHGGSIKHLLQDENDIHLDSISLDKHQMEEICDDIRSKSEVKTLSLRNCKLKDEDMENISEALITSPTEPVMLNFNLNDLSSEGMACIVDIMKNEPTLDVLLLQGNYIGDEGVRILCQGIMSIHHEARLKRKQSLLRQNSQLQMEDSVQIHADQDGNRIPPPVNLKRRSSLFDPAREARFCRLGELDIGDVGLTDKGIEFVSILLEANVYLETLSLSSNPLVSKNGWLRLGQALEKNRRLQNLTLDFNNLGDDAMTFLCRGLRDNRTLTALDLEETNIGERGGRMLLELLKRNTTLLDITLTPGNDIPDSIISEIRRFLALNKAASY